MRNKWPNRDRLVEIMRHSPSYYIQIFHADDDPIVPWSQSNVLFESTINAASEVKMSRDEFEKGKAERKVGMSSGQLLVGL
jgi:abhydrolase domain-containing protein 12